MKRTILFLLLLLSLFADAQPIGFRGVKWGFSNGTPPPPPPPPDPTPSDSNLVFRSYNDTLVSPHIGRGLTGIPYNEGEIFWGGPFGEKGKYYTFADDKAGTKMFILDSLNHVPDRNGGLRWSYLRYPGIFQDTSNGQRLFWAQGTEEGYPYASVGASLVGPSRWGPHELAYAPRIYRPVAGVNVLNSDTMRYYWDGNVGYNPKLAANPHLAGPGVTGPYFWVYQKWKDELDHYTAARVLTAPSMLGPWTELPYNIIDSVTGSSPVYKMSRTGGYEGDPRGIVLPDSTMYLFLIWANGRTELGWTHSAGAFQLDPYTYKIVPNKAPIIYQQGKGNVPPYSKYIFCDEPITPGMKSNHDGNELGIHEPVYFRDSLKDYVAMFHASDKNNPYNHVAGWHYVTLKQHNFGPWNGVRWYNPPKANWHFDFTQPDSATAFTSLTGDSAIRGQWHNEYKFLNPIDLSDSGLVFRRDTAGPYEGYFQLEAAMYTNKYEIEVKFNIGTPEIWWLFGDFPFLRGGESFRNAVRINGDQFQVWHEDGQIYQWTSIGTAFYNRWTTFKVVNNGTTCELFIDGVSKGTRTAPTSKIRLSTIGAAYQGGYDRINPLTQYLHGTVQYVKMKDNQ